MLSFQGQNIHLEIFIEVYLQTVIDKTDPKIIKTQKSSTDFVLDDISKEFHHISKYGCDGSTGHRNTSNGHWYMIVTVIVLSYL
jgi:hypothetical protein